jgi:phage terminase large subunit-like protein
MAMLGEPLDPADIPLFKTLTGLDRTPTKPVEEFIGVIGRRGGKSRSISVIATYIASLCAHPSLVAGERGVVLVIAPDQRQADICLDYIHANFQHSPMLSQLVESRAARTLRLNNGVDVEVRSSDFRRLRGPTYCAVIADEVAFWHSDFSTNPDTEILNAVRPGLATTRGPMFLISSPYARRGELWRLFSQTRPRAGRPCPLPCDEPVSPAVRGRPRD